MMSISRLTILHQEGINHTTGKTSIGITTVDSYLNVISHTFTLIIGLPEKNLRIGRHNGITKLIEIRIGIR